MQTGDTCIVPAIQKGDLEMVKFLCEAGGEELMMLQNEVSELVQDACSESVCL